MPKPFLVLAKITVGFPLWDLAAAKAAYSFRKSCPPRFNLLISKSVMWATKALVAGSVSKNLARL